MTLSIQEASGAEFSGEFVVPYGEDLLRPLDAQVDVGSLACIQTLSSENDDASTGNDDWTFTEMSGDPYDEHSVASLN